MEIRLGQIQPILDELPTPVLITQDEKVVRVNDASRDRFPEYLPGAGTEKLLLAVNTSYALMHKGTSWVVSTFRIGDYVVIVCRSHEHARLPTADMFSVLSQSIREPLSVVMMLAKQLFRQMEALEDPKLQLKSSTMTRSLYQLLRLTNNLSETALAMDDNLVLDPRPHDLTMIVNDVCDRLEPLLATRNITLTRSIVQIKEKLALDKRLLERAFLNLISNSVKYVSDGGRIDVQLTLSRGYAVLTVSDDGEGIDPAKLETIFETAYHRKPLGDARWGAGLGLQFVYQIARLSGGTVLVDSPNHKGTRVAMSIRAKPFDDPTLTLREPRFRYELNGGFDPILVELSDVLPAECFESHNT